MARIVVTLVALCATARAGGLVIAGGSPRAIGRAGVGTASDDGGGALLVNPAGIARRDGARVQLGMSFLDDAVDWERFIAVPHLDDQAGSRALPMIAAFAGVGDWVFGAAAMTSAVSDRAFRRPGRIPPEQFNSAFDYRYAGLAGSIRRDAITLGVSRRFGDAIAIGVSLQATRVQLAETRRFWAGCDQRASELCRFRGRKEQAGDPAFDVELTLTGAANFAPSAVAGILVAPPETRVELAASIGYTPASHLRGRFVLPTISSMIRATATNASASIDLHEPLTLRTGARYLGEHFVAELATDVWIFPSAARAPSWALSGLRLVDPNGVAVDVHAMPSRVSARTHGALRAAADVELISGFLWATAGYAFTSRGTSLAYLSPTFGDLGGHTLAAGLEANTGGFTVTLGWARTWSFQRSAPTTAWYLDNPYGTGDDLVPAGKYDASSDMVGILVDAELAAPDL